MRFEQKKFSNRHAFEFREKTLLFEYQDKNGSGDVEVAYAMLPARSSVVVERNEWLRNVGLLWCGLGALQMLWALANASSLRGTGLWLFLGLLCLGVYRLGIVRYTVFGTPEGNILVIQTGRHDEIVDELSQRRKAQLLALYGHVDAANEPEREAEKFRWLESQGVLTSEEAAERISQVQRLRQADFARTDGTVN